MESDAKYVWTGSVVLLLVLGVIASIVWVTKLGDAQRSRFYAIYFRSQTLEGLQKDSDVGMKGIKVGSVSDYRVSERNIEEVKVRIRVDQGTPIKEDTRAVLKRNLLTGIAKIDLVGSTQESRPLETVPPGEDYPVIPEGQTQFERLADTLPSLMERFQDTGDRLNGFLSKENAESLQKTLENLRLLSEGLAESRKDMQDAVKKTSAAAQAVGEASGTFRTFTKSLGEQTGVLSSDASTALQEIAKAAHNLDARTSEMAKAIRDAANVFSNEVTSMSQSLSSAASSFAKTAENFENPKSLISGPSPKALGPGESIRK